MRDDKKVLSPCSLRMTKSRNCAIISQYSLPLPWCTFSNAVQFAYPFKTEAFFQILQVLINSIDDAFNASIIPTTKISIQIWRQTEVRKG